MLKRYSSFGRVQADLFDSVGEPSVAAVSPQAPSFLLPLLSASSSSLLWMGLYFPRLALESLDCDVEQPVVVVTEQQGQTVVLASSQACCRAGVLPGMGLNAARALLPGLMVRQRDRYAEQQALKQRAIQALEFTPVVSMEADGAVLLEVAGSLRLFGGVRSLLERIRREFRQQGIHAWLACAPNARAALWLARAGTELTCVDRDAAAQALAQLPLAASAWPVRLQQQLSQMGVRTLGDCVRLPRSGFARRIGPDYLNQLDQAWGRAADVRPVFRPPERFQERLECTDGISDIDLISNGFGILLEKLLVFLRQRQAGVERLNVRLEHTDRAPTQLSFGLREATAAAAHVQELLRLHLVRECLPAPVTAIAFDAVASVSLTGRSAVLPGLAGDHAASNRRLAARLLAERLRARLGEHCVYGLELVAEHRPEYAWRAVSTLNERALSAVPGALCSRRRPLWLLSRPQPLAGAQRPDRRGRLSVAERIESGWWDEQGIRRDYYTLTLPQGHRWWVFRDCRNTGWFLHGVFG